MRITTWNVNSIKQRLEHLLAFLDEAKPDVVCLQEIKCRRRGLPARRDRGGWATTSRCTARRASTASRILSRLPLEDVTPRPAGRRGGRAGALHRGADRRRRRRRAGRLDLPAERQPDRHARNSPTSSPGWSGCTRARGCAAGARGAARARRRLQRHPRAARRRDPAAWVDDALFLPESRGGVRAAARPRPHRRGPRLRRGAGLYTFWDYQAGAWQRNNGIRIDHLLLSPQAADRLRSRLDPQGTARPGKSRPTTCR